MGFCFSPCAGIAINCHGEGDGRRGEDSRKKAKDSAFMCEADFPGSCQWKGEMTLDLLT